MPGTEFFETKYAHKGENYMIENPLLPASMKIPGKTFTLPSRGMFYSNGELEESVQNGELHIHPLSGFTELSLKNPDLLFNGKAIVRVFNECVPEVKKPLELAAKDVDAILFFLRMVTYGSEFRIEVEHTCDGAKSHGYAVNLDQVLAMSKNIDPTMAEEYQSPVTIRGLKVYTRPVRFTDVVALFHETGTKKEFSDQDLERIAKLNVLSMIDRVETTRDSKFILEWLETLSTPELNEITEAADTKNKWGIENVVKLKCRDCGSDMDVELPLNPINFFTS